MTREVKLGKATAYRQNIIDRVRGKEVSSKEEFTHYTREGVKIALWYIDESYGSNRFTSPFGSERDSMLFYHSRWHTEDVINRTTTIMNTLRKHDSSISERDVELAILAASFHDTIQHSTPQESEQKDQYGKKPLKRVRNAGHEEKGQNEFDSATKAMEYMQRVNEVAGHKVYLPQDMAKVWGAIALTDPTGGFNGQTISVQGFAKAQLIAQVVELADLGGSGMEGKYAAQRDAFTLFAEENMDFRRDADIVVYFNNRRRRAMGLTEPSDENTTWYKKRFIDWLTDQKSFIRGRQEAVKVEIDHLQTSEEARDAVQSLFTEQHFDESVAGIDELLVEYSKASKFKDWAKELMYAASFRN